MGASADTGPGWCLASDKPGALTTSMPRPRGRRLEKTSGRHPLFKEAAPDGGRNGRPGRLERRPPIPPIHPEQTVPPNRRSLSAFGGWWPLTLAKVRNMKATRLFCGLILALTVPFIVYVLTMWACFIISFQFSCRLPTIVGNLTSFATAIGVFFFMQKARANALGLTRRETLAQGALFLVFLIPILFMYSMKWKS